MPKFTVIFTRNVEQEAEVQVEADSDIEAVASARRLLGDAEWDNIYTESPMFDAVMADDPPSP